MHRVLDLRFPADACELRAVRKAVEQQVLEAGAGQDCARDVVMAVDEACQNVIRHAYAGATGEIVLQIDHRPDVGELVFSLIDFAPRVDPASIRPRDLDEVRPGGIGTHLIREAMDTVEYVEPPPGCGNLLRMTKRIA